MTDEIQHMMRIDKMYDTILNLYEKDRREEVKAIFALNKAEKVLWVLFAAAVVTAIVLLSFKVPITVSSVAILAVGVIAIMIIVVDKLFASKTKAKDAFKLSWNEMRDLTHVLENFGVDVKDKARMNEIIEVYRDRLNSSEKRFVREKPQSFISGLIGGMVVLIPQALLSLVNQGVVGFMSFAQIIIYSSIALFAFSQLVESIRNTFVDDVCRTFIISKLIERLIDIRDFGSLSDEAGRKIEEACRKAR